MGKRFLFLRKCWMSLLMLGLIGLYGQASCPCDQDNDGISYAEDNCPDLSNPDQADLDGDGQGDACDEDLDGDGILNLADNCPFRLNGDQADREQDGIGDACDNCPDIPNPSQEDQDADQIGDYCEVLCGEVWNDNLGMMVLLCDQ
jgi:hypothetical protein